MAPEDFKRKLTAIFSADVAGFSRLMGEDETATVKTLEAYKGVMFSLIKQHRGRVVDSPGDNLLADFGSVVDAVQCAISVQKELQARNEGLPENKRMQFRIGINLGDVIEEQNRIYGDGVNIAARLEALADPGGICISKTAFDHIESKLPLGYEYIGEQEVKNIAKPIEAYRVLLDPRVMVAEPEVKRSRIPVWRQKKVIASAIVVLVAILGVGIWNFLLRPSPIKVTSLNTSALNVNLIEQNWDIMPAGTRIIYEGKVAYIRQDLAHAEVRLRITNTSANKILIPQWGLLDKNKKFLDPFRFLEDDGKNYSKEKIFLNGKKTKSILLRCTSKGLKELRDKEPLFLMDITQTFIFPLNSIPDRATLIKNRKEK